MVKATTADQRVSVIIPCYNASRYIAEALESVLAQTRPPDEVLVVDDGSEDESARIAEGFAPVVRLLGQSNQGEPSARNAGLAHTSGTFVAFLDADDIWPGDSLETRLRALVDSPGTAYAYGQVEQFISPDATRAVENRVPLRGAVRLASAVLFRRAAFDSIGGFNPEIRLGAMMEWMSRAEASGETGVCIQHLVLRRRIHDANSVHRHDELKQGYVQALRASLAHKRSKAP